MIIVSQGSSETSLATDGQELASTEPVETDAIMSSLQITAGNAEVISQQLAEIMIKINGGRGTLGRLIQDSTIADDFTQTMMNLKKSSKGLNENMEAAKHNFLLKGYFNKKAKEAEKLKKEAEQKKLNEKNEKEDKK